MTDFGPEYQQPIDLSPPPVQPDAGPRSPYDLVPPEERMTGQDYNGDPDGDLRESAATAQDVIITEQTYGGGPTEEELSADEPQPVSASASDNGTATEATGQPEPAEEPPVYVGYNEPDYTETTATSNGHSDNGHQTEQHIDPGEYDYDEPDRTPRGAGELAIRNTGDIETNHPDLRDMSDDELRAILSPEKYAFFNVLRDLFDGKITLEQLGLGGSDKTRPGSNPDGAASGKNPGGEKIPTPQPTDLDLYNPPQPPKIEDKPTLVEADIDPELLKQKIKEGMEGDKDKKPKENQELEPAVPQQTDVEPVKPTAEKEPENLPVKVTKEPEETKAPEPAPVVAREPDPEPEATKEPVAAQPDKTPASSRPFTAEEMTQTTPPPPTEAPTRPAQTDQSNEPTGNTEATPATSQPAQWEGENTQTDWVKMSPPGETDGPVNPDVDYFPPGTEAAIPEARGNQSDSTHGQHGPDYTGTNLDPEFVQFVKDATQQLIDMGVDPSAFPQELRDVLDQVAPDAMAGEGATLGGEGSPDAPGSQFPPRPSPGPRRGRPVGPRQAGKTGAGPGPRRSSQARNYTSAAGSTPPPRPTPNTAPNGQRYRTDSPGGRARADRNARKNGEKSAPTSQSAEAKFKAKYAKQQEQRRLQKQYAEKMASLVVPIGRRIAGAAGSAVVSTLATPGSMLLRATDLGRKGTIDHGDGTISVRVNKGGSKTYVRVTAKSKTMARIKARWEATRTDVWGGHSKR